MKWFILFALLATPALAVRPDEMLKDQGLESRARSLSQELRCLVCRNENIDDSDASLAHDLRVLLRERLTSGDTDAQAMAFITDRYGEFVLLNPPMRGANLILWLAGPAMLLAGGGIALAMLRRRTLAAEPAPLSPEDQSRLARLTDT